MDKLLCHICGNMFSYKETLKRHLGSHQNNTFNCRNCKYTSPRKDALKRHSKNTRGLYAGQLITTTKSKPRANNIPEKKLKHIRQTQQILTAMYTSSHYQRIRKFSHGYYMNWTYSPEIEDHIINQNQLLSLKKQMKHY